MRSHVACQFSDIGREYVMRVVGETYQRADDNEESIRKRMVEYRERPRRS